MTLLTENKAEDFKILCRLHPFTKLGVGITLSLYSIFLKNPLSLVVLLALIAPFIIQLVIKFRPSRTISILLFLILFTGINFIVTKKLSHALTYSLRLIIFVSSPLIFSMTTTPQTLSRALSSVSMPSGVIVALLLVWRFFPTVLQEFHRIKLTNSLWLSSWPIHKRFYRGILLPLVFLVFDYTERLSLTLELRGFSPEMPRSYVSRPHFGLWDLIIIAISATALSIAGLNEWVLYDRT